MAEPTGSIIRMPKVENALGQSTTSATSQKAVTDGINQAKSAASTADGKAVTAQNTATAAQTTANGAKTAASTADGKAVAAQKTANEAKTDAGAAQTSANNANNNANGRVPNTRKVNGKSLSADISLTAGDVGALTQVQGDARYQRKGTGQNFRKIWSGGSWSKGDTITVSEDVRGKTIYIKGNTNSYLGGGIQVPNQINIGIVISWYREFHLFVVTSSDGKTLRCDDTSWGIVEVWIQD